MNVERTVTINFEDDDDLISFIAKHALGLKEVEDWELVSGYPALREFTFKIINKDKESHKFIQSYDGIFTPLKTKEQK